MRDGFAARRHCDVHGFFFQTADGIRDPLWSRGLGHVYKRRIYEEYHAD